MEHRTESDNRSISEALEQLESVLECEYKALLQGDGKTVAALADEKLRISNILEARHSEIADQGALSSEVRRLADRVKESASLNHMLLKQLYQHYHGMVELFMRIGGKSRSYGRNGAMTIESSPEKGGEILA